MPSRPLTLRSDLIDTVSRMVPAVVATENPVEIWDHETRSVIAEVLLLDGCAVADSVPFVCDHTRTVPTSIGSGRNFRREAGTLFADLYVGAGSDTLEHAWGLISGRHLRGVSVGYRVTESELIPAGQSRFVKGRVYNAPTNLPLRITTRWQLKEVSLVPIGADPDALIRSSHVSFSQRNSEMPSASTFDLIGQRDLATMTLPAFAQTVLRRRNEQPPENDRDVVRAAFSSVAGVGELMTVVNASILSGFRAAPDTTQGWVRAVPLPNYLAAELAIPDTGVRLKTVPRGATAPTVSFSLSSTGWRLARFGAQFIIDEQDAEDGRALGVMQVALEELGAAARRLIPDLVYSLILANPALTDNVALFHADHANLDDDALSALSLSAGLAGIGNQTTTDEQGDPIHLGLSGRYLIVPPALYGTGKQYARNMQTGADDLIVRAESRLGTAGVVNPATDEIIAGLATNWLLAAPSDQAAGIVVGLLNGRAEPTIRSFTLGQGQWGVGFDIQFNVGVCALSGNPLRWSTGTDTPGI